MKAKKIYVQSGPDGIDLFLRGGWRQEFLEFTLVCGKKRVTIEARLLSVTGVNKEKKVIILAVCSADGDSELVDAVMAKNAPPMNILYDTNRKRGVVLTEG